MSKWIDFIEQAQTGKTKKFTVTSKEGNHVLGYVKWYGPWRKYSFFSAPNTIFEVTCMLDIVAFINKLTLERRLEQQDKKQQ